MKFAQAAVRPGGRPRGKFGEHHLVDRFVLEPAAVVGAVAVQANEGHDASRRRPGSARALRRASSCRRWAGCSRRSHARRCAACAPARRPADAPTATLLRCSAGGRRRAGRGRARRSRSRPTATSKRRTRTRVRRHGGLANWLLGALSADVLAQESQACAGVPGSALAASYEPRWSQLKPWPAAYT